MMFSFVVWLVCIQEGSGGEGDGGQGSGKQMREMGSQDMEEHCQRIFEKVERYTHQVPHCLPRLNAHQTTSLSLSLSGLYWKVEELLEAGRMLFKNLSPEFEERLISSVTLPILLCSLRVRSFVRLTL